MDIIKKIQIDDIQDFINENINIALKDLLKKLKEISLYANSDKWGAEAVRIDDISELINNAISEESE